MQDNNSYPAKLLVVVSKPLCPHIVQRSMLFGFSAKDRHKHLAVSCANAIGSASALVRKELLFTYCDDCFSSELHRAVCAQDFSWLFITPTLLVGREKHNARFTSGTRCSSFAKKGIDKYYSILNILNLPATTD